MAYTANKLVKIAEAEVGYTEKASNAQLDSKTANAGSKNFTKYGRDLYNAGFFNGNKNGFEWCAQFATWCFWQLTGKDKAKAEYIQCTAGDFGAGCGFAMQYYKSAGRFDKTPKVGDQVFFRYSGTNGADHTGIVVAVTDKTIRTIEGNSGNKVSRCSYSRSYYAILGYGHPRYTTEAAKATAAPVNTACTVTLPVLRKGSAGSAVKTLQRLLRQLEYVNTDGKTPIAVDGSFGGNTEAALIRWQKKHLGGGDGICDAKTWNKLLK